MTNARKMNEDAARDVTRQQNRAGAGPGYGPAVTPGRLDARQIVALQRSAGNAAVKIAVAHSRPIQRCGGVPCACESDESGLATEPVPAQRAAAGDMGTAEATDSTPAGSESVITTPSLIVGSLSPGTSVSTSGGERLCFPPAAFTDPQFGSGFGTIAERLIENDYCDTLGCSPATTFIDNFNPTAYLNFLRTHNPGLGSGPKAVALAAASLTGIARPDLMSDDGTRKDYYEIKPLSPSGAGAGVTKLVEIAAFMALLGLPYLAGTAYSPSKDIPIMSGLVLGEPLTVSLNVQRFVPGLVTYSLCLEGNLSAILAKVALAALLAWIVIELLPLVVPVIALA